MPSPTPSCRSYRKESLRVTLDYDRQLTYYITIIKYSSEYFQPVSKVYGTKLSSPKTRLKIHCVKLESCAILNIVIYSVLWLRCCTRPYAQGHIYIYIYINIIIMLAWTSLTLPHHSSQSSISPDRLSRLQPVSAPSCCR